MGRLDPKYTPEQREAIVHAIIDQGLDPKVAVDQAAAGELADPADPDQKLAAFAFNLNTAKTYAGEERKRRRGLELRAIAQNGRPEERLDALTARMLDVLESNMLSIERKGRAGKLAMRDAQLGIQLTKWGREIRGLARGIPPTSSGSRNKANAAAAQRPGETPPDQPHTPDQPSALVQEMQQRLDAEAKAAKQANSQG